MPAIHFEAEPYTVGSWTIIRLPDSASARLPSRGQVMVKGAANGHSFQAPLEPDGRGSHWLDAGKTLPASVLEAGGTVALEIEATKDWPEPEVPADIMKAIKSDTDVYALWQAITPMARWEWLRWIGSSAKQETRTKHIDVARSKLKSGMRRPCCFNRSMCCIPDVSKSGVLVEPALKT